MIPNQWYAVLQSKTLKRDKPIGVVRLGQELVLWRDGTGKAVCMQDRCAHRGVALSAGRCVDGTIACGYHGMRYDASGACVRIPCMGSDAKIPGSLKVPTLPLREENGYLWVWHGAERAEYPPIPWLEVIPKDEKLGRTSDEVWPFNYARLCENHLDAHHWAFVHDSVMVGVGDYFDNFEVKVEDDGLTIKTGGLLRRGDSEKEKKKKGWAWQTQFTFPNLSMISVTPKFKSLIIQTPMDEQTSWVTIRVFQSYTRIQPFRYMLDLYCMTFLTQVPLHLQDFPLFQRQKPNHTGVGVNKLVGADAGIAKYLMIRERLLKQAAKEAEASAEPGEATTTTPNPRLPVLQQPTGVRVPDGARNAHIGRENGAAIARRWLVACLSFPLLVPSLIGSWVLAQFHRP